MSDERAFAAWLFEETGMDAESLGSSARVRAATLLVANGACEAASGQASSVQTLDAQWPHLAATAAGRQALIDALVVPETWFFRDHEAFTALARLGAERARMEPGQVLRVLSVPCSSGEEPYSAAMALLDAGLGADQFAIDAIDISATSVEAAQRGIYGRNAFRSSALTFRDRHFTQGPDGWRIGAHVRRQVTFERANLFDWLEVHPVRYDFIFCRNVLIYFSRDAQDRTIALLRARLAEGGLIFVGPAETGAMMRNEMASAEIALAFAYRQPLASDARAQGAAMPWPVTSSSALAPLKLASVAPAPLRAATAMPRTLLATNAWSASARSHSEPKRGLKHAPGLALQASASATAAPPDDVLAQARRLADAGDLDAAYRLALQATHASAPDADAWYLAGLIADALGLAAEARDYYRKAIYLEPSHYEALAHLATLLDMRGDAAGARRLMRRADRAALRLPDHGAADD